MSATDDRTGEGGGIGFTGIPNGAVEDDQNRDRRQPVTYVRKTTEELIAEEAKKSEQSKARMAELKARQRDEERKRDTHRKVVAGAHLLVRVKANPRLRRVVQEDFNQSVSNPKNRAVIPDLLDEQTFQQAIRAAADKAAIDAKEAAAAAEIQPVPPVRPHKVPGETPSGAAPA